MGEISLYSSWTVAIFTLLGLLCLVAMVSRFYNRVHTVLRDSDANLVGLAGQIRRLQSSLTEQIAEQRRTNRLLHDLLELKRAEMTGEFEIVEEEIPVSKAVSAPPEHSPIELERPPAQFPKI